MRNENKNVGVKALIRKIKAAFRIPENIQHYSREDFLVAEKKYLKYCLTEGSCV